MSTPALSLPADLKVPQIGGSASGSDPASAITTSTGSSSSGYVTKNQDNLVDKPAGIYLNAYSPSIGSHTKTACFLLTATFLPEEAQCLEAWQLVRSRLDSMVSVLSAQEDIVYILSTIEEHPASTKKAKGKKKDEAVEESDDPAPTSTDDSKKTVKYVFDVPPEEYPREVLRVFSERNDKLAVERAFSYQMVYIRILGYAVDLIRKIHPTATDYIATLEITRSSVS